jgi:hypothetical protein
LFGLLRSGHRFLNRCRSHRTLSHRSRIWVGNESVARHRTRLGGCLLYWRGRLRRWLPGLKRRRKCRGFGNPLLNRSRPVGSLGRRFRNGRLRPRPGRLWTRDRWQRRRRSKIRRFLRRNWRLRLRHLRRCRESRRRGKTSRLRRRNKGRLLKWGRRGLILRNG